MEGRLGGERERERERKGKKRRNHKFPNLSSKLFKIYFFPTFHSSFFISHQFNLFVFNIRMEIDNSYLIN